MAISIVEVPLGVPIFGLDKHHTVLESPKNEFRFEQKTNIAKEASNFYFNPNDPALSKIKSIVSQGLLKFIFEEGTDSSVLPKGEFKLVGEGGKVLEHNGLQGWVFKGKDEIDKVITNVYGTTRPNKYNHIHRVFMADKMRQVVSVFADCIHQKGIGILIPQKKLVPVNDAEKMPLENRFLVLCQKMEVYDACNSKKHLKKCNENQLSAIARMLCNFIIRTGYMDANSENIVLHKDFDPKLGDEKILMTVLDTEPQGVLYDVADPQPATTKSLLECALIGLQEFKESFYDIPIFVAEANMAIEKLKSKIVKV